MRNGIALSRSIHWMFDHGLLSLTDDYEILMADFSVSLLGGATTQRNRIRAMKVFEI
jgi:predicted restriction endonuclease